MKGIEDRNEQANLPNELVVTVVVIVDVTLVETLVVCVLEPVLL
jgi:hypothetical protein